MPDFGFVGPSYVAASITQDDQECINWYPETDPTKADNPSTAENEAQRGVIALYPTPGLVVRGQPAGGEVRGMLTLPGGVLMLVAIYNGLYTVDLNFNATRVGTLYSYSGRVFITDNGVSAYITDGSPHRYYYTWGTNTFAAINDGAFIGGGTCDDVDNFMIYNRPDSNQWGCTDVGAVTSNALNLGSVIGASDNLKALIADHRQVLLLCGKYAERWINVGSFPFPFAVIPGSSMQHGIAAIGSIARLGEGTAFLAQDTRGNATVVTWGAANPTPQRISTFAVENAIQSYAVTDDAIAYTYSQSGHEFYMLTFPTADVTWCFDLATNMWHKRAWRDPGTGVYHRHRSNCAALFGGEVIVGDFENGNLYALSQSEYTDAGDPLPCLRRCRHLTSNLNRQFFSDLQIQFQPAVGLQSGQGSDPECILRLSNNGGFTFGNDHILKLGGVGQYKKRAIKRRLGYARDRVFEIEMTDPVYRVVVSANLNASSGAS